MTQPVNKTKTDPGLDKALAVLSAADADRRLNWEQTYALTKVLVLLSEAGPDSEFARVLVEVLS